MTDIKDLIVKIEALQNGFGIFAHAPTDAYERPERFTTSDDLKALVKRLEQAEIVWQPYPENKPKERGRHLVTREFTNGQRIAHEAFWVKWNDEGGPIERWEAGSAEFKDVIAFTDWKPQPYDKARQYLSEGEKK